MRSASNSTTGNANNLTRISKIFEPGLSQSKELIHHPIHEGQMRNILPRSPSMPEKKIEK